MGWEVAVLAYRVLIADDEPDIRNLVSIFLQKNGYTVFTAKNGREAVGELRQNGEFDLVIMDITMPNMDGLQALKKIREADPSAKVVMCTAMGQESMVVEAIKNGAKDFVVKPFNNERICSTVKGILG